VRVYGSLVSALGWVLLLIAVAFLAVGWPADALARRPGGRSGLAWFCLTFILPAVVWIVIAIIGGPDYDLGSFLYFVGYLASVVGVVIGTAISRGVNGKRGRRPLLPE
jgi:hypothetical protein